MLLGNENKANDRTQQFLQDEKTNSQAPNLLKGKL